jgi:ATP-binding protein involved in chromosome partitioning
MSDAGVPFLVGDPQSPQAEQYRDIARNVRASMDRLGASARKAPRIVIE